MLAGLVKKVVVIDGEEIETVIGQAKESAVQKDAANLLLDRGYGKPAQPVTGDEDGPAIRAALEVVYKQAPISTSRRLQ